MKPESTFTTVVKLTLRHKRALMRLAEADGESMAAVVRRLIREAGERAGLWPRDGGTSEQSEVHHAEVH